MKKPVLIETLRTDGLQIRPALNEKFIAELVELLKTGQKFRDALTVFRDEKGQSWVADGHHRLRAYADAGCRTADCEVQAGSYSDALKFALGANAEHGQRRDDETIKRAIICAYERRAELGLPNVPSARLIADMVKCSPTTAVNQLSTVDTWRAATARTGADGKKYPVPTRRPVPGAGSMGPPPPFRALPEQPPVGQPPPRPPAPEVPRDSLGRKIPEQIRHLWDRAGEVNNMLSALSRIRVAMKEAQEIGDLLFSEVSYSSVIAHLDQAYAGIQVAKPYAVCPFCQGHGCKACCKSGLLSKFRWDKTVPRDLKQQVEAVIKQERQAAS